MKNLKMKNFQIKNTNTNIIEINNLYNMIKSLQISGKIGPVGPEGPRGKQGYQNNQLTTALANASINVIQNNR